MKTIRDSMKIIRWQFVLSDISMILQNSTACSVLVFGKTVIKACEWNPTRFNPNSPPADHHPRRFIGGECEAQ